jgi:hypothetical protein
MSLDHWPRLSAAVAFAFVQGTTGVRFALLVAPVCGLLEPALLPVGVLRGREGARARCAERCDLARNGDARVYRPR